MDTKIERYETVVIGAGQAGLATGYHLTKARRSFVVLEANARIGDNWRRHWDSLRLFTPSEIDGLPGMRFPARNWTFPTKDETAAYLERYAAAFDLPVRTGVSVTRLSRAGDGFLVETAGTTYEASNVVVATGSHRVARIPDFALDLDPRIQQLHSSEYKNPAQLRPGTVLIVGAANSGAEIAIDVARTHPTLMSGVYRRSKGGPSRSRLMTFLAMPVIWHLLTIDTPIGRSILRNGGDRGAQPVERVSRKMLDAARVEMVPRVARITGGRPVLEDGRTPEVASVIWCTGFNPGLEWIDIPIHDERGEARHTRGVVTEAPGLYVVGRPFQYALTSEALNGVGRDAGYIAKQIVRRMTANERATAAEAAPALPRG